jgi:hypothetical protein
MQKHPYVAVRWYDNSVTGANSRVALRGVEMSKLPIDDTRTSIVSYRAIGFQEYISLKTAII